MARSGYETHLVIAASDAEVEQASQHNVTVHQLLPARGRLGRMLIQPLRCLAIGRKIDADVYHLHDPELIPIGVALSLRGKKVIYDAHEDLPNDILTKEWVPRFMRSILSSVSAVVECFVARYFVEIVTATPFIAARFRRCNKNAVDIKNFPITNELATDVLWENKHPEVCYVGAIDKVRGIRELVRAMELVESGVRLNLVGAFADPATEMEVRGYSGWRYVNPLGVQDRQGVSRILARSIVGLVTLHPLNSYLDALPIKMFEYMSAGIPLIASDFPLWRQIIQGSQCGLLVSPLNPGEIARAIDYLATHPHEARRMGENGHKAVLERYNWPAEENRLLAFYESVVLG